MTSLLLLASLLCPDMPAGPHAETPALLSLDAPAPVQFTALDVVFDGSVAALTYRLTNPAKVSISLRLSVEVAAERCAGECCAPLPLKSPDLRIGGAPIVPTGHTEARGMRRFTYALAIPAGGVVQLVQHDPRAFTYDHAVLAGVGLSALRVSTPWRWGPIGAVTWTIRRTTRPWGVEWPKEHLALTQYVERAVNEAGNTLRGVTTLKFTGKDVTPREDLRIKFDIEPWGGGDDCVGILLNNERAFETTFPESPTADGAVPDAIIKQLLKGMSDAQLSICRNTPYALHGYGFKRPALRQAFYGDAEPGRVRFAPNAAFSPRLLSPRAVRLIRHIKAEEARRRARRK